MNITQTLLKNLSGGELQKLAEEMLSKIYSWKRLSNYGQVEEDIGQEKVHLTYGLKMI